MLNNQSGFEDRIAARYVFEERIRIGVERYDRKFVTAGWARNLSESGLGAFVAFKLAMDEHVTLEIPLAFSDKLIVPAQVARIVGTEYGFRFTALSPAQRSFIRSAVKGHAELPSPMPK
jgi:PilZ domain